MRAVQSLHKDSSLTGVWPGHHRDKGDSEFARRQVQRGHPDAVWFMDGAKDSRSLEIGFDFFKDLQCLSVGLRRRFAGYAGPVSAGVREILDKPVLYRESDRQKHCRHPAGKFLRRGMRLFAKQPTGRFAAPTK